MWHPGASVSEESGPLVTTDIFGVLFTSPRHCGCLICTLPFAAAYRNLGQNLWGPHRYGCLSGVRVRTVVSGSCAAHSLLITTEGKLWSWGKSGVGWDRATHGGTPPNTVGLTFSSVCLEGQPFCSHISSPRFPAGPACSLQVYPLPPPFCHLLVHRTL